MECQFKALESCPESDDLLSRLLDSLPRSLDATYERMLLNIPPASAEYAQRMLTFLCCAKRPLKAPELIDGIAVELGDAPKLNPRRRLKSIDAIKQVCPGLIEVDEQADGKPAIIRIAHFSVQEYLESDRIRQHEAASFGVTGPKAHASVAAMCLTYLMEPALLNPEQEVHYPLAPYAASFWHKHFHDGDQDIPHHYALRLFQSTGGGFENWIRINSSISKTSSRMTLQPIFYASLLGLDSVLAELLRQKPTQKLVNERTETYGNALLAASICGHEAVVKRLFDWGADVNVQGGPHGNALQAALVNGHIAVVRQLLNKGADVDEQGGHYENALQAASSRGYTAIVKQLLDKGANVNVRGGLYGNALQAASANGHTAVIKQLLDKGANIDVQGGLGGNALHAALIRGHTAVVRQLLDKGADVNVQGGHYGNALQAASVNGHIAVVRQLLDRGANVNAQSGHYGCALQAASANGHVTVVGQLLDSGANVNAQSGYYGCALQAASAKGHVAVVRQLLDRGANVNAHSRRHGSALQAASASGHGAVVGQLLDGGANVNAPGLSGSALETACWKGHGAIVEQLLDAGADVNMSNGEYRPSPLDIALRYSHKAIVEQLLQKGAKAGRQGERGSHRSMLGNYKGADHVQ